MRLKYLLLSLTSVLLLSLPFFENFSGLLLLAAFAPLLLVEDGIARSGGRGAWRWAAFVFLLWNLWTTYWIMYATFWGMVGAVVVTSALETLVFQAFILVKRRAGKRIGYLAFAAFWLTWEHFFFNAEISWPWLTLGNGFSKDIRFIQWYEITGTLGGSCWALASNALLAFCLQKWATSKTQAFSFFRRYPLFFAWLALVTVPAAYSLIRFYTYHAPQDMQCKIAVLQPNIDPFSEKFDGMEPKQQLDIMLRLADSIADSSTNYIIAPETALPNVWENNFASDFYIGKIRSFCRKYPQARFITGATTLYRYGDGEELPPTARKYQNADLYYDIYNTALQIDTGSGVQVYHKSKLVVGVEMLPYPKYMKFLNQWAINLGGSYGGLGTQKERTVFSNSGSGLKAGVAVCYESIYGRFCTDYVRNGANLFFIITNDGWWRNTPGHRQHLNYARLRAIELRRSIARSANTGISAIINQRGEIEYRTQWWTRCAFTATVSASNAITPYVRFGDVTARMAQILSLFVIAFAVIPKKNRA